MFDICAALHQPSQNTLMWYFTTLSSSFQRRANYSVHVNEYISIDRGFA